MSRRRDRWAAALSDVLFALFLLVAFAALEA